DIPLRQQRLEQVVTLQQGDDAAISRRRALQLAPREQPGRAGRMLDDEARVSRDMPAEMTDDNAGVKVGAAAWRGGDPHLQAAAAIEVLDRLRMDLDR